MAASQAVTLLTDVTSKEGDSSGNREFALSSASASNFLGMAWLGLLSHSMLVTS